MNDEKPEKVINGCPVIYEANGYSIIDHPNTGFQVYSGVRVGIYKTMAAAIARTEKP